MIHNIVTCYQFLWYQKQFLPELYNERWHTNLLLLVDLVAYLKTKHGPST